MDFPTILSCGETGVSQGVLQAAQAEQVPVAGWCQKSGKNLKGIPVRKWYGLKEHPWGMHDATVFNVRWSKFVIIVSCGDVKRSQFSWKPSYQGGSLGSTAHQVAFEGNEVCFEIDLDSEVHHGSWPRMAMEGIPIRMLYTWFLVGKPRAVCVVGPNEEENPGIQQKTFDIFTQLFQWLRGSPEKPMSLAKPTKRKPASKNPSLPMLGGKKRRK